MSCNISLFYIELTHEGYHSLYQNHTMMYGIPSIVAFVVKTLDQAITLVS